MPDRMHQRLPAGEARLERGELASSSLSVDNAWYDILALTAHENGATVIQLVSVWMENHLAGGALVEGSWFKAPSGWVGGFSGADGDFTLEYRMIRTPKEPFDQEEVEEPGVIFSFGPDGALRVHIPVLGMDYAQSFTVQARLGEGSTAPSETFRLVGEVLARDLIGTGTMEEWLEGLQLPTLEPSEQPTPARDPSGMEPALLVGYNPTAAAGSQLEAIKTFNGNLSAILGGTYAEGALWTAESLLNHDSSDPLVSAELDMLAHAEKFNGLDLEVHYTCYKTGAYYALLIEGQNGSGGDWHVISTLALTATGNKVYESPYLPVQPGTATQTLSHAFPIKGLRRNKVRVKLYEVGGGSYEGSGSGSGSTDGAGVISVTALRYRTMDQ